MREENDGESMSGGERLVVGRGTLWNPRMPDILKLLEEAEVDGLGLIPWGSNYTFLIELRHPDAGCSYAVYKPLQGEAPLYDFPEGTLFRRERAAFLVSEALGWSLVPPTVVREGPYGVGMVQLFIDADTEAHYFTFGEEIPEIARRVALFDLIINNTDRKAGHLLKAGDGSIWAIDHGLTFHPESKVRTVIWEFADEPFPERLVEDLRRLLQFCEQSSEAEEGLMVELRGLLNARERRALRQRVRLLIETGAYPQPTSYRSVPWPSI